MKIGLYFGSFNPVHIGHLIIANYMVIHSDLDEIWFVVSPHNPHKKKSSLLADHHRLRLVELAVEPYGYLKASNIEFKLSQPSYTSHTLAHIEEKYPNNQFGLIMGEDNLNSFHKWKNYEVILENHQIYVYPRIADGKALPELLQHNHVHKINAPIVEIAATYIRKSIEKQLDVRPLLPPDVWQYIDEMNFYKN
ncbi:nicotinate (nicotinamide) nucleotide adenylyltransferase [Urechidicola sp. KH5]